VVTVDSVEPVVVILVPEGEQADTPAQVATAAMAVVFHMEELLVRAVVVAAVAVQLFPHHRVPVAVLAFRVKEEMEAPAPKVQILDTVAAVEVAPVAVEV
jgi:hypothetical protein